MIPAAAVSALALALAGCGNGGTEPGIATAAQTSAAAPSSAAAAAPADPIAQYVESQRAWVKCLRAAGVDVPDPDAKGRVDLSVEPGKRDPAMVAAQQKCRSLSVAVPDGVEEKPTYSAEDVQHRRDYAKCMREQGVTDFADPGPNGEWPGTEDPFPAGDWLKAQEICAPVLAGGAPDPNATPKPAQG